jgi:hypothetical protein
MGYVLLSNDTTTTIPSRYESTVPDHKGFETTVQDNKNLDSTLQDHKWSSGCCIKDQKGDFNNEETGN